MSLYVSLKSNATTIANSYWYYDDDHSKPTKKGAAAITFLTIIVFLSGCAVAYFFFGAPRRCLQNAPRDDLELNNRQTIVHIYYPRELQASPPHEHDVENPLQRPSVTEGSNESAATASSNNGVKEKEETVSRVVFRTSHDIENKDVITNTSMEKRGGVSTAQKAADVDPQGSRPLLRRQDTPSPHRICLGPLPQRSPQPIKRKDLLNTETDVRDNKKTAEEVSEGTSSSSSSESLELYPEYTQAPPPTQPSTPPTFPTLTSSLAARKGCDQSELKALETIATATISTSNNCEESGSDCADLQVRLSDASLPTEKAASTDDSGTLDRAVVSIDVTSHHSSTAVVDIATFVKQVVSATIATAVQTVQCLSISADNGTGPLAGSVKGTDLSKREIVDTVCSVGDGHLYPECLSEQSAVDELFLLGGTDAPELDIFTLSRQHARSIHNSDEEEEAVSEV